MVQQEVSDSLNTYVASDLESALVPFCGGWYLQTKIWVFGILVAVGMSYFLAFSVGRPREHMSIYVYTHVPVPVSKTFSICAYSLKPRTSHQYLQLSSNTPGLFPHFCVCKTSQKVKTLALLILDLLICSLFLSFNTNN